MDLSKYKALFITESREHLDEMTRNFLDLEKNPSDASVMDEIFRHAHSIKGMASSMEYKAIEVLSHALEDAMDIFRKGMAKVAPEAIDRMLAARDAVAEMVDEVEHSDEPVFAKSENAIREILSWCQSYSPVFKDKFKFAASNGKFKNASRTNGADFGDFDGEVVSAAETGRRESNDAESAQNGFATEKWFVTLNFEGDTEAPAARAFLALKRIQALGEIKSDPTNEEIRAGKFSGVLKIELKSRAELGRIQETLGALTGVKQYRIEPLDSPRPASLTTADAPDHGDAPTAELTRTIRVDTRALDHFVNMVGELLTVKSSLRDVARALDNPDLDLRLDRLEALIHDLHNHVMDVRMMPLEIITSRLPRAARDLARTAGKELDLIVSGEDIELDRAILERLNDPFVHMLRNSVDHGIEPPGERERFRKPRRGKITIKAQREKDMIVIEFADDGKGMDIEAIKETAIAKGIVSAEVAEAMSAEDALALICVPGFSTSETVSFISGRGVGMDVVKSTIESLGGALRIYTKLGEGTRLILHLPRTVSILNVLLVSVEPEIFAAPIGKLLKTVEIPENSIKETQRGRMLVMGADLLPLFDLRELLRLNGASKKSERYALIVDHGVKPFAVLVDGFMGQEEAFIRPLGRPLSRIEGLAGVMTLGDGKPVFVLDIPNLRGGSA